MIDDYFSEKPDAYVKFKWEGHDIEGEFFQDTSSLNINSSPTKGYIRPFDKILRQEILNRHQIFRKVDFFDFCKVSDLIGCDSLVTHSDLEWPYVGAVVTDFEFIEEIDLISERERISDCREDILRRQYILAKALDEPKATVDKLYNEFKEWATPDFEPLRYKRTVFTKFRQNSLVRLLGIILVLLFFYVNLKK